MADIGDLAEHSNAWPFVEARRLRDRFAHSAPASGLVVFETGYGPSGLPHIGTFAEVARTTMVRNAFHHLSGLPTRLIAFSDDMDALRKVPDNIPEPEMIAAHLGKPLSAIPDPFGTHESFAAHNNARLRAFLDAFGFDYEFKSATETYRAGDFDATLRTVLAAYDEVTAVILPTLGAERRATYSPFLPICAKTGRVLQAPVIAHDVGAGTITYQGDDGHAIEVPVTGGACKLQWKADWAMRWLALGVDYEMSGKDLIPSVQLSGRICRVLGGTPPENLTYELFLDEQGQKISKSRGNGLTIDEWLTYGSRESLSLYMYQSPRKAKRLHFDVIPRHVDDYLSHRAKFAEQDDKDRLANPVWHIHDGAPGAQAVPLSFTLLMNLAGVCHSEDKAVLWGFIARYAPAASPAANPMLDELVGYAAAYYRDFVKPGMRYRAPDGREAKALAELSGALAALGPDADAETIQNAVYEVGKHHDFANLRDWFRALYEILLGQSQGPRMGSFIALYGIPETVALIDKALAGADLAATA